MLVVGHMYVGLPFALGTLGCGFEVTGFDLDEGRKRLAAGESFGEASAGAFAPLSA